MVAIDGRFGTRWEKSMLCTFGLSVPKFGERKGRTKTETVTMAGNARSQEVEEKKEEGL